MSAGEMAHELAKAGVSLDGQRTGAAVAALVGKVGKGVAMAGVKSGVAALEKAGVKGATKVPGIVRFAGDYALEKTIDKAAKRGTKELITYFPDKN